MSIAKNIKKLCTAIVMIVLSLNLSAQAIDMNTLKNAKADQLTNQQIAEFVEKYKADGYTLEQVETACLQSGMPQGEWAKFKARIRAYEAADKSGDYKKTNMHAHDVESEVNEARHEVAEEKEPDERGVPVFGTSLFNRRNLTFEPNLRLPTPENYQLGPDDELIIDVYGYAENTIQASVSRDGYLRIPAIGQVQVNGLTIEQARKIIIKKLAAIYTTINSGETSVTITLGNIRSIKVLMIGEVYRPGTYTLPSVASVFNALNAAGGPNRNGSFRKIKVLRNNEVISTVDIYDFLISGNMKSNVRLQDQDVIKVEPYQKRIELEGELKHTGYFEAINDEKLSDMITFAGGFTTNAYKDRITVFRITDKDKSVADVALNEMNSFVLQDGDVFSVGKLLDRFTNRVQIDGAVFRPGTYALTPGLTLKNLIEKADGLREDVFLYRGTIVREKDDLTTEMLTFNVANVVNGTEADVPLKKEDKVFIASVLEMQEKHDVSIFGEVKNAGTYTYHDNMTLKDLIFRAGGLRDDAENNVEVSRLILDPEVLKSGVKRTEQYTFMVDRDLNFIGQGSEFMLEPYDQVIIRPISGFSKPKRVMLEGEVLYPGNYILASKNERISDVIKRAGGVNRYAYVEGAYLIRTLQPSLADEQLQMEIFKGIAAVDDAIVSSRKFMGDKGIVGINLEKILANPGSKWDLILQEDDIIHIPEMLQTVQVKGEVLLPTHVVYEPSASLKDYIDNAGGFGANALKRKTFVVYANGTAKATKRFMFFRKYPEITPGAQIYVPRKQERKHEGLSIGDALHMTTSLTSLAAIVVSLFRLSR